MKQLAPVPSTPTAAVKPAPAPAQPSVENAPLGNQAFLGSNDFGVAGATESPRAAVEAPSEKLENPDRAPSWLTDDSKQDFLAELRAAVSATADEGMAGTGRTSQGCPYIEHWFGHYGGKDAAHIQKAIHRFEPGAGTATSGKEAIPLVAARVRRSVDQWALTGEISGLPEGTPAQLPGVERLGRVFFQARAGGAQAMDSPAQVRNSLGRGEALGGATRGKMERALGRNFEAVRLHTDSNAQGLAGRMNARAFTVGDHVAFGAGEFRPGSMVGDALLAHELAHVAQQNGNDWQSANESEVEQDADSALEAALIDGVPLRPQLSTGLSLARCSKDKAPVQSPKAGAGKKTGDGKAAAEEAGAKEDPKVTKLKSELVATYGFSSVTDPEKDAKWTVPQLEKMKRALAKIPAAERAALKGVELRRVVSTTEHGAEASGLFHQEIAPGTGIRSDRIEMADKAFAPDPDYDDGSSYTTFGGQKVQGAPSETVLAHEVGHAVEAAQHRAAEEARVKADMPDTKAFKNLQAARKAYNDAIGSGIQVPAWTNAQERAYMNAIIEAEKRLDAITTTLNAIPEKPSAAETKKGGVDVKAVVAKAKAAIAARDKAGIALPQGSSYRMTDHEGKQDNSLALATALIPLFEARAKVQADVEKATAAEEATEITIKVSGGSKVKMTRRLAEFVAIIETNKIDIKQAQLGEHVESHWPKNPEEAYAELYSFSIMAPEGLKKFDKNSAVATYFTSPVGLKDTQKAQATAWIASHQ